MIALILGLVAAGLAALVHVYIFVLESVLWTRPATRRVFGVRTPEDAETTRPLAFNQGFYNLFLALVTVIGIVLVATGASDVGAALIYAGAGSMVLAAVVLLLTNRRMLRAAAIQGMLPLIAVVLIAVGSIGSSAAVRGLPPGYEPLDVIESPAVLPDGVELPITDPQIRVLRSSEDELFVVTYGSSSCPSVPAFYDSTDAAALTITLEETGGPECTADFGPTASRIRIPDGFESVDEVRIEAERIVIEQAG